MLNGLTITVVGMAIVFIFLIILVLVMRSLHLFLKAVIPSALQPSEEEKREHEYKYVPPEAAKEENYADIAAVIAAAKAHISTHYRG